MDFPQILNDINAVLGVLGNVVLAYTAIVLLLFTLAYYAIFDPKATTGGKLIFRFMLSLSSIILLILVALVLPDEVFDPYRSLLRLLAFGFVAYSVTSLAKLLFYRKWFPHKLKKATDIHLVKVRHTSEIPVVFPPSVGTRGATGDSSESSDD